LFAISSDPGQRFSICFFVVNFNFSNPMGRSSGLTVKKFQHGSKPFPLAVTQKFNAIIL
jgi:hypothetical protein